MDSLRDYNFSSMNLDSSLSSIATTPSPTTEDMPSTPGITPLCLNNQSRLIGSNRNTGKGSYTEELRQLINDQMSSWEAKLQKKIKSSKKKALKRLQR